MSYGWINSNASFILSILYSFLIELSAQFIGKNAQKKIELPFEQTSMCDWATRTSSVTRGLSYFIFQFRGQYWRIITLPVRYLSTPSYCMQGNNYHTLLQFDALQCKTTCRARCGFSSIGRFLSRGIVSVLFPAVVRITGLISLSTSTPVQAAGCCWSTRDICFVQKFARPLNGLVGLIKWSMTMFRARQIVQLVTQKRTHQNVPLNQRSMRLKKKKL